MRAAFGIILGSMFVATVVVAVFAMSRQRAAKAPDEKSALTADENMDLLSLPAFELVNQNAERVTNDIFIGQVSILEFFFSSCPFICPPMNANMQRAQAELAGTGVQLVSISVDPDRDTPERLASHAQKLEADPDVWMFLTGEREIVSQILTEGLLLSAPTLNPSQLIELEDGTTMSNIAHPSRFFLIGPAGEVLGFYDGLQDAQVDAIIARSRRAAEELRKDKV